MRNTNPIVALANVVASQQEMLHLMREKYDDLAEKYDKLINKTYIYGSAEFTVKDAEHFFIMAQNRINELEQARSEHARLLNCKIEKLKEELEEEKKRRWHWQKWDPDKEYPFDKQGCAPMISALYQYSEDSHDTFHDFINNVDVPLAGKYGEDYVGVEPIPDRGVFKIKPAISNAQLVAVCLHYNDVLTILDELPELEE